MKKFLILLTLIFTVFLVSCDKEEDEKFCTPYSKSCDSDNLMVCNNEGSAYVLEMDCSLINKECKEVESLITCVIPADICERLTCGEYQECDANLGKCVSYDKCRDANCLEGESCDPGDGKCYGATDKCEPNPCLEGEICNPADGSCSSVIIEELDTIVKAREFSSTSGSQEGVLLENPLEGVVVAVRGLPTSSKHAVVIRQADANEYAGIYVNLDGIKAEAGFPTLAIGNLIEIKGKVVEYFDRTELQPQSVDDIVVKTASVTIPTPIDVNSFGFEEKYESMVLNITNVPFTVTEAIRIDYCGGEGDSPCPEGETCQDNGHCSGNIYDTTLTDADGKTIKVSSSFAYPRVELAFGEVVNKLAGVMTFDYGEFKLYPRSVEDVVVESK